MNSRSRRAGGPEKLLHPPSLNSVSRAPPLSPRIRVLLVAPFALFLFFPSSHLHCNTQYQKQDPQQPHASANHGGRLTSIKGRLPLLEKDIAIHSARLVYLVCSPQPGRHGRLHVQPAASRPPLPRHGQGPVAAEPQDLQRPPCLPHKGAQGQHPHLWRSKGPGCGCQHAPPSAGYASSWFIQLQSIRTDSSRQPPSRMPPAPPSLLASFSTPSDARPSPLRQSLTTKASTTPSWRRSTRTSRTATLTISTASPRSSPRPTCTLPTSA